MTQPINKTDTEWQKELTPEQFEITRKKGTERPFTGKYNEHKDSGSYHCVCCNAPLFHSDNKYNSGSGWPSFWQPINDKNVLSQKDESLAMLRIEVICKGCGAHLGHVFEDGPQPTGLRYCVNSASLQFTK